MYSSPGAFQLLHCRVRNAKLVNNSRGGEGDCVKEGGGGEGKCEERALERLRYYSPGSNPCKCVCVFMFIVSVWVCLLNLCVCFITAGPITKLFAFIYCKCVCVYYCRT
jgi:hypothetical protein